MCKFSVTFSCHPKFFITTLLVCILRHLPLGLLGLAWSITVVVTFIRIMWTTAVTGLWKLPKVLRREAATLVHHERSMVRVAVDMARANILFCILAVVSVYWQFAADFDPCGREVLLWLFTDVISILGFSVNFAIYAKEEAEFIPAVKRMLGVGVTPVIPIQRVDPPANHI